jgi:hypothetical protein
MQYHRLLLDEIAEQEVLDIFTVYNWLSQSVHQEALLWKLETKGGGQPVSVPMPS